MKVDGTGWMTRRLRAGRGRLFLATIALAMVASACTTGTYAVDIFPEQHYQQSKRRQEPPRMYLPDGAVPITGREVPLDSAATAQMKNPLPTTQQSLTLGAEVYRVNCVPCHGPQGQGNGMVGQLFVGRGYYAQPPNLMLPVTQGKSDGQIFYLVTNGVVVMPKFGLLLNENDRWSVVQYLRFLAQQQAQPAQQGK